MASRKNLAQSLRGSMFVLGFHTPFRPFRALSTENNLWVPDSAFNHLQDYISRIWIGQSLCEEMWLETEDYQNLVAAPINRMWVKSLVWLVLLLAHWANTMSFSVPHLSEKIDSGRSFWRLIRLPLYALWQQINQGILAWGWCAGMAHLWGLMYCAQDAQNVLNHPSAKSFIMCYNETSISFFSF